MNEPALQYKPLTYRLAGISLFFIQGIVFSTWACRIADVKTKLHLTDADVGSVLFALPMGQLLAMGISGYLVTRFTSRTVIRCFSIFYPAFLLLLASAESLRTLFFSLMLFGMAANLNNISINTQAVDVERIYGRAVLGTFHGVWSLAGFVGGIVSAMLVGFHVGIWAHFTGIVIFAAIAFAITQKFLAPHDFPREVLPSDVGKKPRSVWKPTPFILALGVLALGSMSCEGTMFDWSVIYFRDVLKTDPEVSRAGFVSFMCAMASGRFLSDYVTMKIGSLRLLQISGVVVFFGLMTSVIFPIPSVATIGFLLVGFGVSSVVPTCYRLAGLSRRISSGMAIATVATIGFFGFLAGPPFIGYIADLSSLRVSFACMAFMGLVVTFMAPILRSRVAENN